MPASLPMMCGKLSRTRPQRNALVVHDRLEAQHVFAFGGKHSASPTLRCWALDLVGGSTGVFGVSITG
jgi:hypothetical protein